MTWPTFRALRVLRRLPRGSSSPVVIETAGGSFVTKLRGAAQGIPALVAEIIVAELAERLGLPVPDRALIELATDTPTDDRRARAAYGAFLWKRLKPPRPFVKKEERTRCPHAPGEIPSPRRTLPP